MAVLALSPLPVRKDPFDHILQPQFLDPAVYEELERSFPTCGPSTGPIGFSYYWGDPEYEQLITQNWAWKRFFATVHSPSFAQFCAAPFADAYRQYGCRIDCDKAVYVPYRDSRKYKERRHLEKVTHRPQELYVRLDVHQGHIGYRRRVHRNHHRRVATLPIYSCDSHESGREGGDLVLHRNYLRVLLPEAARIRPQRNLIAGFACRPVSLHLVPDILSQSSPRNFLQVQLSSQVDAWPR
jgi:hypothetical protein